MRHRRAQRSRYGRSIDRQVAIRYRSVGYGSEHSRTLTLPYSDTQNVHNTSIQISVQDSINRITCRRDLAKFDSDTLITMILNDDTITEYVKSQMIDYCQDDAVHSLLLLTFAEVLWYVMNTISTDFKTDSDTSIQREIKQVLNQEIMDAE